LKNILKKKSVLECDQQCLENQLKKLNSKLNSIFGHKLTAEQINIKSSSSI
jgi:hypothetical protein